MSAPCRENDHGVNALRHARYVVCRLLARCVDREKRLLRRLERALRREDRKRFTDRVHGARLQRAGKQMRPRRQRDPINNAPTIAHDAIGADDRILRNACLTQQAG